ncbi:REP element-mobilizing transposase RayT [Tenacibaculum sp. MAR_2009_124]|uniref:IS200/IS605 family transposase n=1 Tax=Tenacibaculum sp. MAR_2009_124 TaxID=1250059 RepID=UPI00089722E2|nr:IS200/IS605 family transposase [Tenacibaculum sp. MAR_2009_124]SEB44891.1 REP element-mobilizing transposase RayT [Tenacibaculum sp. MAR_2009_124]SEC65973.1 REP element-mobilizing transposase RayT [Tenacibaculum sp. MAR_2009_124]
MSEHIYKSHNKSLILYHFVCPVKYRRTVFTSDISKTFKDLCLKLELRYDIQFLEIGIDGNHVHFLIQSVPMNSPKKIIGAVKSITAKEIFRLHPEIKRFLWGGKFWTSGYYVNTVGQYANEEVIKKYLQNQGNSDYEKLHSDQLRLF